MLHLSRPVAGRRKLCSKFARRIELIVSLRAKLLLGLGLILIFLVALSSPAYRAVLVNRNASDSAVHTEEVLELASDAASTVSDVELRYLQFLLSGSADALSAYQSDAERMRRLIGELMQRTADNPPQVERWRNVGMGFERALSQVTDPAIALRGRALAGEANQLELNVLSADAADQRAFAGVRAGLAVAIGVEEQLLRERDGEAQAATGLLEQVLVWGTLATTSVGLIVAFVLSSNVARAMERFAATAQAVAAGDLQRRIGLRRTDEIGRAARAFDQMAESVEREVAALASLQRRTQTILNSTAEGIFGIDPQGVCTIVNPSAARLTGYTLEELRGACIHDLLHHTRADGSPYPREECPAAIVMRAGTPLEGNQELFWRKDGSSFPVEFAVVPVRENRQVTGAVVSFRDITERSNIERMKDEFISIVSHELRTPLTSIRGSLGLLSAGLLGPISDRASRMVEVAVTNTDRLIRLINDILDIERIESGHAPMDKHWTDARDLVLRSVESIRAVADEAGLQVLADAEPILLRADPDRLQQTLTNLLGNAIKFSPPGAAIDVRARREGDQAVISVRDRGHGIPGAKLESIFGRFEQVDATDAREKGGSGLGLAIARSIVEQHGGRIWAESTLGQGSIFYFTIPLSAALSERLHDAVQSGDRPTILVCDDDPDILEVVGEMLARHGYRPLGASSGEEALECAARERPSVILLDLALPGMSGWETLLALKDNPATQDIPVVILSGLERATNEPPGGHADWIAKPVTPETLRGSLERVLARRTGPARILVVEDDPELAGVLTDTFGRYGIETHTAASGEAAIAISQEVEPDLLLLDLALPSGTGFDVVDWFRQHDRLRHVSVVVYTARDLGLEAAARTQATDGDPRAGAVRPQPSPHGFGLEGAARDQQRGEASPPDQDAEPTPLTRLSPDEVRRRVLTLLGRVVPAA